jgi:xanthosine utilization system XapX-like protein
MAFDTSSSRKAVIILGSIFAFTVTIAAVVLMIIFETVEWTALAGIGIAYLGLLGLYVGGKSYENGRVRSARILAQIEDTTHVEGEG